MKWFGLALLIGNAVMIYVNWLTWPAIVSAVSVGVLLPLVAERFSDS